MALPVILAVLGAIQAANAISKTVKTNKHNKKMKAFNKKEEKRVNDAKKREAMERVIGPGLGARSIKPGVAPNAPSTVVEDILGPIAGIGSQVAGRKYGQSTAAAPAPAPKV